MAPGTRRHTPPHACRKDGEGRRPTRWEPQGLVARGCQATERSDVLLHMSPGAEVLTTWTWKQSIARGEVDPVSGCLGLEGNGVYDEDR